MNRTAATLAVLALATAAALATSTAVRAAKPPAASATVAVIAPGLRGDLLMQPGLDQALIDVTSFAASPPGADATPTPKPEEWKDAPSVRLSHDVDACKAYRIREWVKIHCADLPVAGASLLAGKRDGVAIWVDPPKDDAETMKTLRATEVIFPVRRGDGRLFQVGQFGEGYDGPISWNVVLTISEQWIEGDRAPIVSVR